MSHLERFLNTTRDFLSIPKERTLEVRLARHDSEIRAAQKLRKEVFGNEPANFSLRTKELDADDFDPWCKHLIVIDHSRRAVVGTYRILDASAARSLGRYYADEQFDLSALSGLRDGLIELGRSCVHPAYRDGAVIRMLWSGLGDYLQHSPETHIIGCPSISADDGGHLAAAIYRKLSRKHLCAAIQRVTPRDRLPVENLFANCDPVVPPLIKAYLRAGAQLMGEPHCDKSFGTIDFLMMIPVKDMSQRYSKKFIEKSGRTPPALTSFC